MQSEPKPKVVTPCQRNPRLFYSSDHVDQEAAKATCRQCPFRAPCLRKAFAIGADGGVWGGFDEVERSFYAKLFGTDVGKVVQELPVSITRRLKANKVMKTGPDVELAAMEA